ncbi:Cas10/Cmr2 second palm domain-containing protein [Clostridium amazonitimonense]|uniref:Cas10/Cmr2 second palm domain-containing protein n=1 Tax=Clostridium amazonitimonense TaxID=1499689 RepID=UPI000509B326|nr:type III-B CRISPR-associated protein Cas10/Cmr2 [Clostridium amazonitimonense]
MSYLLGVTIGPVQTYIEDSRKLIDLYGSSKIISDIAKEIHNYISKVSKDAEIIYPNHEDIDDIDYSNYMIFKIKDFIDLKNIENKIFHIFNCKIEYIKNDINTSFNKNYIDSIEENFHLFWAMEKIETNDEYDDNKYYKAYENLTRSILSIKNTYEFDQLEQISEKKCLICGKRNIVTQKLENKVRRKYILNSDEDLCSLCLFKRSYLKDENLKNGNLKSIYAVAIRNWKSNNRDAIEPLTNNLKDLFNEEDKYYNPNEIDSVIKVLKLKEKIEDKILPKELEKKITKIKSDLKDTVELEGLLKRFEDIKKTMDEIYFKQIEIPNIELPNYEYCFIQFDIDNLGCWMSGKYLENKNDLKEYQKKISNVLVKFGKKLKEDLKNNCDIIYSGGDDFLSILPTENIIDVIDKIDELFNSQVENELKEYMSYDKKMTYSTSITIAQCKDPMSYALNKTRLELEIVKNRYKDNAKEKNGVAVNHIVNNGKEVTCYLKKEDLEAYFKLIKGFKEIESSLSFSYINNFKNEFIGFNFDDMSFEKSRSFGKIAMYELKRLILRSKSNKEVNIDEYIESLFQFIKNIFHKNSTEIRSNHVDIDFKNIINIMRIYQKLCKDTLRLKE